MPWWWERCLRGACVVWVPLTVRHWCACAPRSDKWARNARAQRRKVPLSWEEVRIVHHPDHHTYLCFCPHTCSAAASTLRVASVALPTRPLCGAQEWLEKYKPPVEMPNNITLTAISVISLGLAIYSAMHIRPHH